MDIFISSSLYPNKSVDFAINDAKSNFCKNIELSAPHIYQTNDALSKMLIKYKKNNLNFILHNYFPRPKEDFVLNIASKNLNTYKNCIQLVKNAINLSSKIGSEIYGIHAGYLADSFADKNGNFVFNKSLNNYSDSLEKSSIFLNNILNFAKNKKVKILIENLFPFNKINNSLFCTSDQINDLMEIIPKDIGILLDLGHLQISSKFYGLKKEKELEKILKKYSNKIFEVHLSENNKVNDLHNSLDKNSWQINAIKIINECKTDEKIERKFCLEVRNEKSTKIKKCLDLLLSL